MKKIILVLSLFWLSMGVQAHGFDYSVITFAKKEDNTWRLVIRSSLDAFRKEVRMHFSETPYSTPDEFNEQLLKHLHSTLKIIVKDKNVSLGEGTVQLGHETSVVFKDVKIPPGMNTVQLINGAVKDIYRHTTKLFVDAQGQDKASYILNKSNNFTANFSL